MIDNCKPWEFPALCTPIGQLHQTPPMPVPWNRARGKQMGLGARRQGQLPSRVTRNQPRSMRIFVENTFFFNFLLFNNSFIHPSLLWLDPMCARIRRVFQMGHFSVLKQIQVQIDFSLTRKKNRIQSEFLKTMRLSRLNSNFNTSDRIEPAQSDF